MERTIGGYGAVKSAQHRAARTTKARDLDTNPRSRRVNRVTRADRYAAFAADLGRDLNPRGSLERLMADHVVQSAWRLKATLERQADRDAATVGDPADATPKRPPPPSAADRAARSVRDALESLDYVRSRPACRPAPARFDEIQPNEWPIVPDASTDDLVAEPGPEPRPADDGDGTAGWEHRLVFDFDVSDISPVVKGTWVAVGHVVSLIVDGWTWADILRSHPELIEDDIRACLAYTLAEESPVG